MSAPPRIGPETLAALENARDQHAQRRELRTCSSCLNLWPDGTCRAETPSTSRDGKGVFPLVDGQGCAKWDPIFGPGKVRYGSAITDADRFFFETTETTTREETQ